MAFARSLSQAAPVQLTVEDILASLGFTLGSSPLAQSKGNKKIVDAVTLFVAQREGNQQEESLSPESREMSLELLAMMSSWPFADLLQAEAAAQILAMVAADESNMPQLLPVDKWVECCLDILKSCKQSSLAGSPLHHLSGTSSGTTTTTNGGLNSSSSGNDSSSPLAGSQSPTAAVPSESLVVCAASCLADLMNNPATTVMCSARAAEIFQCMQWALLLPDVSNRMIYFQACRGISEVLHPSTWPIHAKTSIPRKLLEKLSELLVADEAESGGSGGVGGEEGVGAVVGGEEGKKAASPEREGGGSGAEKMVEKLGEKQVIQLQAATAILMMAANGAASLIVQNEPGIVCSLQKLHLEATVEEVVVQADAALMALWLSNDAYAMTDKGLRPAIARNVLWSLGSEELVDLHQSCSLALVASSMNTDEAARDEMLATFAAILRESPALARVLVGHIDDRESLAHQSVVYFVLHITESEECATALLSDEFYHESLVNILTSTSVAENHYAPVAILSHLVFHKATRNLLAPHFTEMRLYLLGSISDSRARKQVEIVRGILGADDSNAQELGSLLSLYRDDPASQRKLLRSMLHSRNNHRRSRSEDADTARQLREDFVSLLNFKKSASDTDDRSDVAIKRSGKLQEV